MEKSNEILSSSLKIDEEFSYILDKLNSCISSNNAKEVLENIKKYYEVYGLYNSKQYKDYNIIISVRTLYGTYKEVIQIIKEIYSFLGIISKNAKLLYVNPNVNENDFSLTNIKKDEEIIIIDLLDCEYSEHIIKYKIDLAINENPNKIYIILENNRKIGSINALLVDKFQWCITINEIDKDNKIKYIKNFLDKNNIKANSEWISDVSFNPYYIIKNTLANTLVQCKLNNTYEIINKQLKSKNQEKNKKNGYQELDELIGLDHVKEQIIKIINYLKICKDRSNMPMLHMCFLGNPRCRKNMCSKNYWKNICRRTNTLN